MPNMKLQRAFSDMTIRYKKRDVELVTLFRFSNRDRINEPSRGIAGFRVPHTNPYRDDSVQEV